MLFSSGYGHILIHGHIKPEPWLHFPCFHLLGWASHCSELNARKPRRAVCLDLSIHTLQLLCSVETPKRKYLVDCSAFFSQLCQCFYFSIIFRLNEGHTVYLERHICGRLFGEKFRHFHALGGWGELQNSVNESYF